jgi:hypothetical protein
MASCHAVDGDSLSRRVPKSLEKYGALSEAERRIRQRGALSFLLKFVRPVFTRLARTAFGVFGLTDRDRSCRPLRKPLSLFQKPPQAVALPVRAPL